MHSKSESDFKIERKYELNLKDAYDSGDKLGGRWGYDARSSIAMYTTHYLSDPFNFQTIFYTSPQKLR